MLKNITLILFSAIAIVSCKKDLVERYEKSPRVQLNKASKTSELKTNESFGWSTSKTIILNLQTEETSPTLIIGSNGEVLVKALLFANSKNEITLTVSSNSEQIKVLFNGKEFPISTSSNEINLKLS